jgi:hypothetical protein
MSGSEGIGLMGRIAKLRRDTPRNGDVLAVCAALERLLTTAKPVDVTARPNVDVPSSCPVCEARRYESERIIVADPTPQDVRISPSWQSPPDLAMWPCRRGAWHKRDNPASHRHPNA